MIKLFALDVDGCITEPFVTPDWTAISKIRNLQQAAFDDETIPELTLLTGRPYPYAEAVAQWLNIRKPFGFESGGGLFDPVKHKLQFNPHFTDDIKAKQDVIRKFVLDELLNVYEGVNLEFTKYTDLGVVSLNEDHIKVLFQKAVDYIAENFAEDFEVHMTEVSINIICQFCNKGEGLDLISEYTGIPTSEMAYIGDSSGDIKALQKAGRPFAPSNAISQVHEIAESMQGRETFGVLEAYEKIIAANRAEISVI